MVTRDNQFLYGRHQIARYLNVSPTTVSRWIKNGSLPVVRMTPNGAYLCSAQLIDGWLAELALAQHEARSKQQADLDDLSDIELKARVQELQGQTSATG